MMMTMMMMQLQLEIKLLDLQDHQMMMTVRISTKMQQKFFIKPDELQMMMMTITLSQFLMDFWVTMVRSLRIYKNISLTHFLIFSQISHRRWWWRWRWWGGSSPTSCTTSSTSRTSSHSLTNLIRHPACSHCRGKCRRQHWWSRTK